MFREGHRSPAAVTFLTACRIVTRHGYTPVDTRAYRRLRAWCDLNGWPPPDWQPGRNPRP